MDHNKRLKRVIHLKKLRSALEIGRFRIIRFYRLFYLKTEYCQKLTLTLNQV